ncbi:MAG: DUF488 domain-containing protein [bacterium JZ-2024 1]
MRKPKGTIWTIGHSTHSEEHFIEFLRGQGIAHLVDIRRFPRSRKFPHFSIENLARALQEAHIKYFWLESLGGFREAVTDTQTRSQTKAFAGYSAYMATVPFSEGLHKLIEIAEAGPTAIMCAEGLWWRCHRRLVADVLVGRHFRVLHMMPDRRVIPHKILF